MFLHPDRGKNVILFSCESNFIQEVFILANSCYSNFIISQIRKPHWNLFVIFKKTPEITIYEYYGKYTIFIKIWSYKIMKSRVN